MPSEHYAIAITEIDEQADVFRTLGGAAWLTGRERDQAWRTIPAASETTDLVADKIAANGTILAERPITEDTARRLLGVDDLQPLRDEFDRKLAEGVPHAQ